MALVSEIEEWTRGKPSLIEIRETKRLSRQKFATDSANYNALHNEIQSAGWEVVVPPVSDVGGDEIKQAISVEVPLYWSPRDVLLRQSLVSLQKNIVSLHQHQVMLRHSLEQVRREYRRIREKLRRTIASGSLIVPENSAQQYDDQRSAGGKKNMTKRHCA